MRKYLIIMSVFAAFTLFNLSCEKDEDINDDDNTNDTLVVSDYKEGIYNPEKKISKIYMEIDGVKSIEQTWTWENDLLVKISMGEDNLNYEEIEYDNKQMKKIITYENGVQSGYTLFTYSNGLFKKIDLYQDGVIAATIVFEHNGKKISKMTATYYTIAEESNTKKSLKTKAQLFGILNYFIPIQSLSGFNDKISKSTGNVTIMKFTYNGDNVKSDLITSDQGYSISSGYTYDSYLNPFYNALAVLNLDNSIILSKNNVLSASQSYNMGGDELEINITYAYEYSGNFPIKMTKTHIFEELESSEIYYYEYLN